MPAFRNPLLFFVGALATLVVPVSAERWVDATISAGLEGQAVSLVKFVDLDSDQRPDAVILPKSGPGIAPRVFLNKPSPSGEGIGFQFQIASATQLPAARTADTLVFADLDNDGIKDAILSRYNDIYQDDYSPPVSGPKRSAWMPGNGDGSFGQAQIFEKAPLTTTRAIAIGDVNQDGLLDCLFGNWYQRYFTGYEAFSNDLLIQYPTTDGEPGFTRWPFPLETSPTDFHDDLGGRPTYGVAITRLDSGLPMVLELNYGRRWNRLYRMALRGPIKEIQWTENKPGPLAPNDSDAIRDHLVRQLVGENIASATKVDGDGIRHGRHPKWNRDQANAHPRSQRPDEAPFRSNGNTFDCAVGDIDNDGDFDLFVSTIIHAWAGESSDRSRFLVNQLSETGELSFATFEHLSVDRIPDLPDPGVPLTEEHTSYNQGDIYAELADLNHDGRLDLVLCSSDYPDPPPHDERLRIYFQQTDGRFLDVTSDLGLDHVGAGMPSLADVDLDGDLDLLVGQSFNRLTRSQRIKASIESGALSPNSNDDRPPEPRARLYLNESSNGRASIILHLQGDPKGGVSSEAFGAIVRVTADTDGDPGTPEVVQSRQLLGPAGHSGKQNEAIIHVGLNAADRASKVVIEWQSNPKTHTIIEGLEAGRYLVIQGEPSPQALSR
ncbi:MAG: hypothetical protein CMI15_04090 [Opitutaceae bacterium]|nr:hypothetical protein [Opitutaceae bacterium]